MTDASSWHRWQLTAPLAALSRPLRPAARPHGIPSSSAGAAVPSPSEELTELPVLLGGARARQVDATTCGSAVLVMLAATGDPGLAGWLETGRLPNGDRSPEIPAGVSPGLGAAERFAAAQREVKRRTGQRALGLLPWPAALGTPPWTAAREARFPGVRYRVRPVDDGAHEAREVLSRVATATGRGIPVPLFTGGDLRSGLAHAVPRHVVLAVPPPPGAAVPGVLQLYEPGRGTVHRLALDSLLDRRAPHPALGHWTHVVAALLPEPR